MNTFTKPDGTIETASSGCCCAPGDKHSGVHTRGFTYWVRIDSGAWFRLQDLGELTLINELADMSPTVKEFKDSVDWQGQPANIVAAVRFDLRAPQSFKIVLSEFDAKHEKTVKAFMLASPDVVKALQKTGVKMSSVLILE